MRKFFALFKREIYGLFVSPIAYVVMSIFCFLAAYFFSMILLYSQDTEIMPFLFGNFGFILMVLIPFLTMRTFGEERVFGTFELLYTSPLSMTQILLSKFFALLSFYTVMLFLTFPFPLLLMWLGHPDFGPIGVGYLGMFLMGSVLISIGIFASLLGSTQLISAVLAFAITLLFWMIHWVGESANSVVLYQLTHHLSITEHFKHFQQGVLSLVDASFYLAMTVYFLAVTGVFLDAKRWF